MDGVNCFGTCSSVAVIERITVMVADGSLGTRKPRESSSYLSQSVEANIEAVPLRPDIDRVRIKRNIAEIPSPIH